MNRRTARGNRLGLAIVGAVLTLVGLAALLRGLGLVSDVLGPPSAPVTDERTRDFVTDQAWFWPAVAALLIVIALLALRWLMVQTRTDTVRTVRVDPDTRRGRTRLPARAVTGALEEDLTTSPYLRRAQASLGGDPAHPRLALSTTMAATAEPGPALQRVREAVDRSRQALDEPRMPASIQLRAAR